MKGTTKALFIGAAFAATMAAMPVFAMGDRPVHRTREHAPPQATSTPEIDAGSGLASAAAVIAALCLAWERRRRRNA